MLHAEHIDHWIAISDIYSLGSVTKYKTKPDIFSILVMMQNMAKYVKWTTLKK